MIIFSLQANAIGRSAKTVREFLEKHYTDEVADSDDETIKLAIKALLEVSSFLSLVIFLVLSKGFMKIFSARRLVENEGDMRLNMRMTRIDARNDFFFFHFVW